VFIIAYKGSRSGKWYLPALSLQFGSYSEAAPYLEAERALYPELNHQIFELVPVHAAPEAGGAA
jgi:hypothetical protein